MASISVSLVGDTRYRDALNMVARQQNTTVGALVRAALDEALGVEITDALSFFDQCIDSNQRSLNKINDVSGGAVE